jgi:hypothetical protein
MSKPTKNDEKEPSMWPPLIGLALIAAFGHLILEDNFRLYKKVIDNIVQYFK